MKKKILLTLATVGLISGCVSIQAANWNKVPNVAQYKFSDWSQMKKWVHGVSLCQAKKIANSDPTISYFFYENSYMALETNNGDPWRYFSPGDAVFFSGSPWWGSAPGYADGYVKDTSTPTPSEANEATKPSVAQSTVASEAPKPVVTPPVVSETPKPTTPEKPHFQLGGGSTFIPITVNPSH
jgi:hypothetical protein